MRRLLALLICLVPLIAAGQSVGGDTDKAVSKRLLATQSFPAGWNRSELLVPLWRTKDGRLLLLKTGRLDGGLNQPGTAALLSPLALDQVGAGGFTSGLAYGVTPNLQAHADVSQYSWANQTEQLRSSEFGATYDAGPYNVGVSVGASSLRNSNAILPRVIAGGALGVDGLSDFDSSTLLMAHGRLALSNKSGIDLGASVGMVRLLPGNSLGISTLDQKALSFGLDHGPLSGSVVGRTMQPQAGSMSVLGADRRWKSIDLGVTWRLPWRGQLSVGAQNLWSSGTPANTPTGPEPDQSRTPYVQYHQDL